MSIVDKGAPPSNVTEQAQRKNNILNDVDQQSDTIKQAQVKQSDVNPEVGFAPKPKLRTFEVIFMHELYKINIEVLDISISDFQIAIKIPRVGFKFEPVPQSAYILRAKGKEYNVTYLGGLFDFPTDEHWTITFLMEQTPTKSPVHEKIIETFELDKE